MKLMFDQNPQISFSGITLQKYMQKNYNYGFLVSYQKMHLETFFPTACMPEELTVCFVLIHDRRKENKEL